MQSQLPCSPPELTSTKLSLHSILLCRPDGRTTGGELLRLEEQQLGPLSCSLEPASEVSDDQMSA
jgi:hypothetical protein